ncbi:FAD-dependent monooxygenase [Roseibium salinum]|nr:FAD-dependent monooxygenase [Roseibium salinum]
MIKTIKARLVVAADGRNSLLRETVGIDVKRWSYPQVAVVLNLEHRLPHHNVSTEFHTPPHWSIHSCAPARPSVVARLCRNRRGRSTSSDNEHL